MAISRIFLIGMPSILFSLLFFVSWSQAHQSFHSEDIISLQHHTIQRNLLQDLNDDETVEDDDEEDETEDEVEKAPVIGEKCAFKK